MKKRVLAIVSLICFCLLFSVPAFATSFNSVDVTVLLMQDGSAQITEVWDVYVDEGTEMYIVKDNLGNMQIKNLSVTDETGAVYEFVENWDIDASLEEKAYKCGINYSGSAQELCFGKSSYGSHVYTVTYEMTNYVNLYSDGVYGFNQRVINDQLSDAPSTATVTYRLEGDNRITDEWADIWAFGFNGEINFTDNGIKAVCEGSLKSNESMTIMCSFGEGYFTSANHEDKTFQQVKDRAFQGSSYNDSESGYQEPTFLDKVWDVISFVFSSLVPIIMFVGIAVFSSSAMKNREKSESVDVSQAGYCRQIPLNMEIPVICYLLQKSRKSVNNEAIFGAYFLKWVQNKVVELRETESSAFFGLKTKKNVEIIFLGNYPTEQTEVTLCNFVKQASGQDEILQEKEFYNWSSDNYHRLKSWNDRLHKEGRRRALEMGLLELRESTSLFGLIKHHTAYLTQQGIEQIRQIQGFKNYLMDFTIINERKPVEVELWNDYLVFATLMDIADQVGESFSKLYPGYFEDSYGGNGYMGYIHTRMLINTMSSAAHRGISAGESAAASAGSGGSSSFGGGGGFSGGGSGGGSR